MRQRRDGLRLTLEAGEPVRIARDRIRQDLDRNVAIELLVSLAR